MRSFLPAKEYLIFTFVKFFLSSLSRFFQRKQIDVSLSFTPIASMVQSPTLSESAKHWSLIWHGKITDNVHLSWITSEIQRMRNTVANLQLIISTYDDEYSARLIKAIGDRKLEIVYCEDVGTLEKPFPTSICQQIETFYSGLQGVRPENKILKLRLDQSLHNQHFTDIFDFYLNTYTVDNRRRIFTTSFNTFRQRACSPSDMLMFGDFPEMSKYWARIKPRDYIQLLDSLNSKYADVRYGRFLVPEVFLACRYLESHGMLSNDASESHFDLFSRLIGVIDSKDIGFSWIKFNSPIINNLHLINPFFSNYSQKSAEMTYMDWLVQFILIREEVDISESIL